MQDVEQPGTPESQASRQAARRPAVARMPKAQAQRIVSGLKKGVLVASVALFGGFAALAAGNVVGVTAQSSSSSQSSDSSSSPSQNDDQDNTQNNSNFFGGGSNGSVGGGSSSQQPSQVTNAS